MGKKATAATAATAKKKLRKVYPFGRMCLVKKDDDKNQTSGGILLPDDSKIPVISGRLVAISKALQDQKEKFDFEELDRVYFDTRHSVPVDFEPDNKFYFIDFQYIYGKVTEDEIDVDPDNHDPAMKESGNAG